MVKQKVILEQAAQIVDFKHKKNSHFVPKKSKKEDVGPLEICKLVILLPTGKRRLVNGTNTSASFCSSFSPEMAFYTDHG